uniref:EGF-like domain-containing protein n=1 Tax=Gouania willdenowi TaxID=441366 RepID=A0A8C5FYD6_GOUWI
MLCFECVLFDTLIVTTQKKNLLERIHGGICCVTYFLCLFPQIDQLFRLLQPLSTTGSEQHSNECAVGDHGCDANARCGNIIGSYFCQCYQGFNGDGHSCFDIDECIVSNGLCEHNCTNEPGAYSCQCSAGYQLQQDGHNCTDIDECVTLNGTCGHICINTQGSFQCSCKSGYQLHIDGRTCVDIDECKLQNGGCSHSCTNSPGGHVCHCPPPLLLDIDDLTCSSEFLNMFIHNNTCLHQVNKIILIIDATSYSQTDVVINGGCDHTCSVMAEGNVQCSCQAGWKLEGDMRSCVGKNDWLCGCASLRLF